MAARADGMEPGATLPGPERRRAQRGLPVNLDKDLRERHGGAWEGLTDREIREFYPDEYQIWSPPGGEPTAVVADRAAAAFERIADNMDGGSLTVVVSHGAAIGMGMSRLLGLPERERVLGSLANCSWSVLGRRFGRWRLLEHNVGALPQPVPDPGPRPGPQPGPRPGADSKPGLVADAAPGVASG